MVKLWVIGNFICLLSHNIYRFDTNMCAGCLYFAFLFEALKEFNVIVIVGFRQGINF